MSRVKLLFENIYLYFRYGLRKRDNQIILFGSWFGNKFADNSRFLFQYLAENKEKYGFKKVVWATRNEKVFNALEALGYTVVMIGTKESDYYHKIAGIHVVCNAGSSTNASEGDIDGKFSFGAIRINLWHGIPAKGVDYASIEYKKREKAHPFLMRLYYSLLKNRLIRTVGFQPGGWNDAYRLSTTPFVSGLFVDMTKLPVKKMIETGYPRNCTLSKMLPEERKVISQIIESDYSILYLPTFRSKKSGYTNPLDDSSIVQWIKDENILWIQKPHSADKSMLDAQANNDTNIVNLPDTFDINVLLEHVDVVLTDYSSVCFDAIYHHKPIVYYVPDLEQYMEEDRGFVISPDVFMVGPKAFGTEELLIHLKSVKRNGMNEMSNTYYNLREKIWKSGTDMEEIWTAIREKIGI